MTGRNGWAEYPQTEMHIDKRMFIPRHKIDDAIAEMDEAETDYEFEGFWKGVSVCKEILKKHIESEG